ncbi:MAG: hypothetical protein V4463_23235 [Pseudomonadota bacterium]
MDTRLDILERDVSQLKTEMATIRATYSTREELAEIRIVIATLATKQELYEALDRLEQRLKRAFREEMVAMEARLEIRMDVKLGALETKMMHMLFRVALALATLNIALSGLTVAAMHYLH